MPGSPAACAPLLAARAPLQAGARAMERELVRMARRLPVAHFCDDVPGFGHMRLASVVGECGDLSCYRSHSALWKRCGLAVIGGGRQRRVTGEAALEHGYSPARRSVMWVLADPLLRAQGKGEAALRYRLAYDHDKARHLAAGLPAGHAHNRAMRYMTKRLLRDLWQEWRRIAAGDGAIKQLPMAMRPMPRPLDLPSGHPPCAPHPGSRGSRGGKPPPPGSTEPSGVQGVP